MGETGLMRQSLKPLPEVPAGAGFVPDSLTPRAGESFTEQENVKALTLLACLASWPGTHHFCCHQPPSWADGGGDSSCLLPPPLLQGPGPVRSSLLLTASSPFTLCPTLLKLQVFKSIRTGNEFAAQSFAGVLGFTG